MTEADWLLPRDPRDLLDFLRTRKPRPSERKMRLCALECCRRFWPVMEEACREVIVVTEQFVEGQATRDELTAAHNVVRDRNPRRGEVLARYAWAATDGATRPRATVLGKVLGECHIIGDIHPELNINDAALCELMRDIFGNPFQRAPTMDQWRTTTTEELARTAYESRDFGNLPVLADAIEDAGCTDTEVLAHCRGPGPHVRGCWVVDLILGKE